MTAGFVIELVGTSALEFEDDGLVAITPIGCLIGAVLSTLAGCQLEIGFGEIGDEQFGVETAFRCS